MKEKESVRLLIIEDSINSTSQNDTTEGKKFATQYSLASVVPLSSLASIMKDHLGKRENITENIDMSDFSKGRSISIGQDTTITKSSPTYDIECILVDSDQYHMNEDSFSGRDSKSTKTKKKLFRTSVQRAESYLSELFSASNHAEGCILLAVNLPFVVLREFNSAVMFGDLDGPTVVSSVAKVLENHVKHRKTLKTLAMCVQNLIRRQQESLSSSININKSTEIVKKRSNKLTALIYSIQDDMFDLLTLTK